MTNEELAELEREARHEMDIFDRPSIRTSLRLIEAIATAREAEALRAENARLREALGWIGDRFSEAVQADCENGVRWINERAAKKYLADFPDTLAAIRETQERINTALEQGEAAILRAERNEP